MKKLLLLCLLFISGIVVAQTTIPYIALKGYNFTAAGNNSGVDLRATGATYVKVTFTKTGTVTVCSLVMDSSVDNSTWGNGDVLGATDCSANGTSVAINGVYNYVRVRVTSWTGSGSVMTVFTAYQNDPGNSGTVTSIATTSPIAGGVITTTGTITCTTCTTAAATYTSGQFVKAAGNDRTTSSAIIAAADIPAVTVSVTTSSPITVSTTLNAAYYLNQHATAGTAITFNLPTAAAGKQFCFGNSYNGSAANTGALTIATSAAGQFIIDDDGTLGSTGGNIASAGAGGDKLCIVGVDSTHWQVVGKAKGTWTKS